MTGRMNRWYDERMYRELGREYYDHSEFFNYGYWDQTTPDQKTACENLINRLLGIQAEKSGTILDVACGKGASTAHLLQFYPAEDITAINISEKQIETARTKAPGCTFLIMDAAHLDFPDNSFDTILCLEAVFHFKTRERFLEEAYRVLRPGGYLLQTDILLSQWGIEHDLWWIEKSNQSLTEVTEYKNLLQKIGYTSILIEDATGPSWEGHYKHLAAFCQEQLVAGKLAVEMYNDIAARVFRIIPFIGYYLLVAAQKPLV